MIGREHSYIQSLCKSKGIPSYLRNICIYIYLFWQDKYCLICEGDPSWWLRLMEAEVLTVTRFFSYFFSNNIEREVVLLLTCRGTLRDIVTKAEGPLMKAGHHWAIRERLGSRPKPLNRGGLPVWLKKQTSYRRTIWRPQSFRRVETPLIIICCELLKTDQIEEAHEKCFI